jgi:aryl-alcohol dehydrogenase-like predicted oxidoreductase
MDSAESTDKKKMVYRFLGNTGLRVSVLSLGTWITASNVEEEDKAIDIIKAAYDNGVNFFDTAESYGLGLSETVLGRALKTLPCEKKDIVVSTKFIMGGSGENDIMLGAKHLYEGVRASLKRMDLEYFDIVFEHRFDSHTPLIETLRSFDQIIREGKAFYWSTSEWNPVRIAQVMEI